MKQISNLEFRSGISSEVADIIDVCIAAEIPSEMWGSLAIVNISFLDGDWDTLEEIYALLLPIIERKKEKLVEDGMITISM